MNLEKQVANIINKCYKGKVKDSNLQFLIDYLNKNSVLGVTIQKQFPDVVLGYQKDTGNDQIINLGEYKSTMQTVFLNSILSVDIERGKEGALSQLFDTYGHELTHHRQLLDGKLSMNSDTYTDVEFYSTEMISCMAKAISSPLTNQTCSNISHACYLKIPYEEEAREHGYIFSLNALRILLDNKYIDDKTREKLTKESERVFNAHEEKQKAESFYYKMYDQFLNTFKNIPVEQFMNPTWKECPLNQLASEKAFKIWLNSKEPEALKNGYFAFIGTGDQFLPLYKQITNHIKSESFPKDVRDDLTNTIVYALSNKNLEDKYYDKNLINILSTEQIINIYKSSLTKNIKKLETPLFEEFIKDQNNALILGKELAANIKNIKINSPEEARIIALQAVSLSFYSGIESDDKTTQPLNALYNELHQKYHSTQEKEIANTQSKR